jgi:hypothetical protein
MLEFNHDLAPSSGMSAETRLVWADALINYLRSGDPKDLPAGVIFVSRRHHSEPSPVTIPEIDPRGARTLGKG